MGVRGTFKPRGGPVDLVEDDLNNFITLYLEAKQLMQSATYGMAFLFVNPAILAGTLVIRSAATSSPMRSGTSFLPSNSQDKGSKNG